MPAPNPDDIQAILAEHQHLEGPLLPILHALQDTYGHIPAMAAPLICAALNISKAELHGVISFYHDFREAPAGRHVLKICRAEACKAMGGDALADAILKHLRLDWHGTTPNGALTVEPVYCLGLCACAPAVMLDDRPHARMDVPRLHEKLAEVGL
jgi:formate dehydrogenase subunit gamma